RIPLAEGTLDQIVGYLYAKDIFLDGDLDPQRTLRGLERPVSFVPEEKDGFSVLKELQARSIPIAIVIDEYGGTSGLVTVEDLVEEIVGEIRDELDVEPPRVIRVDHDWEIDARATI